MFRKMRRSKQEMPKERAMEVLKRHNDGVMAVYGEEGYPYAVPVNYLYEDGVIYLHGAKSGHKIEAIERYEKVSFCVVDKNDVVPKEYTCKYRSVIAFGKAKVVTQESKEREILEKIAIHFWPEDTKEHRDHMIDTELKNTAIIAIDIEHITGKEHKSFVGSV